MATRISTVSYESRGKSMFKKIFVSKKAKRRGLIYGAFLTGISFIIVWRGERKGTDESREMRPETAF